MNPFKKYDLVRIKDLSDTCQKYFPHSTEAIVMYTYKEKYGGRDDESMSLYVKDHGEVSWYKPCNLTLVEHGREDLLKEWRDKAAEVEKRESDLDWIFSHGDEIASGKSLSGNVAYALFRCLSDKDMWGSRGEGIVYYENAVTTFCLAKPFLKAKDKEGWLAFAKKFREEKQAAKEE